jgi:cytochrome c-type biogenesis protein CcmH
MRKLALLAQIFLTIVLMLMLGVVSVFAQQATPIPVTDDQVNAIAQKLYCPVCENIPLDACGTAACADWRAEIRQYLEAGWTEQQIIEDFVRRFGDRVVGTPQDPILQALSLVTPWLLIGVGVITAFAFFYRWRRSNVPPAITPAASNRYRDLLEQDLSN